MPDLIMDTRIAGVTFDNPDGSSRQELLQKLKPNAKLVLKREPTNQHDENAVKVLNGKKMLGYLPRQAAAILAPVMDNRCKVRVERWSCGQSNAGPWGVRLQLAWRGE